MQFERDLSNDFSILISGQITSRVTEQEVLHRIEKYRKFYPGAEIVVSSYAAEVTPNIISSVDKFVINADPGADIYGWDSGPFMHPSNTSRMLTTLLSGLKECTRKLVLRTRIEFSPESPWQAKSLLRIHSELTCQKSRARFYIIKEDSTPPGLGLKWPTYAISDFFSISTRELTLKSWEVADKLHRERLTKKYYRQYSLRSPQRIGETQLLGMGLLMSSSDKKVYLRSRYSDSLLDIYYHLVIYRKFIGFVNLSEMNFSFDRLQPKAIESLQKKLYWRVWSEFFIVYRLIFPIILLSTFFAHKIFLIKKMVYVKLVKIKYPTSKTQKTVSI